MPTIQFEGQTHEFPDNFSDADISAALGSMPPPAQPLSPAMTTGLDVLKSGGIGLAKGAIGMVGLPGDIGSMVSGAGEALGVPESMRKTFGTMMATNPLTSIFATGPNSTDIRGSIESKTGPFYKPQTTAGEFAQTLGEFAPAAIGPGGAVRKMLNVAVPATATEASGQIARAVAPDLEPYARVLGGIGAAGGLSKAANSIERAGAIKNIPSQEEIKQTASDAYNAARRLDVTMSPASTKTLSNNIGQTLDSQGFRDFTAPKTYRAIEELKFPKTKQEFTTDGETSKEVVSTLSDILATRKVLGSIASDPTEKKAAAIAIGKIDTYIRNLANDRPAIFGNQGSEAARLLGKNGIAPGNYAAAKRSELISEAMIKAERQAASAGSGSNIDNATRQQIKSILNNPKKSRGYSPDEIAAMELINRGNLGGNAARFIGKLAPTGVVSGTLSSGLGALLGSAFGPLGSLIGAGTTLGVGSLAHSLANASTARKVANLDALIRSRSPLARSAGTDPNRLAAILRNQFPWQNSAFGGILARQD